MVNVTVENASAKRDTLGTTVTVQRTPAPAGPRMARSAVAAGTASVGSVSAQSREPLGRLVRSALPALMPAAARGKLFPTNTAVHTHKRTRTGPLSASR